MQSLAPEEMVVFSDAVHPKHQSRPEHDWFPKGQKTALCRRIKAIQLDDLTIEIAPFKVVNAIGSGSN